ncbi:collagen alpha-2(I) chain-like [Equus przewalskii]|uniref:Collagen alpha-2(I) chain-like n=1 Tax=Equus przewalskii TaxID=9798 RepID=A0ABM4P8S9_EQUPR
MGSAHRELCTRTQQSCCGRSYRSVQFHRKASRGDQRAAGGGKSLEFPGTHHFTRPHGFKGRRRPGGSSGLAESLGPGAAGGPRGARDLRPKRGPTAPSFLPKKKLSPLFPRPLLGPPRTRPAQKRNVQFLPRSRLEAQPILKETGKEGRAARDGEPVRRARAGPGRLRGRARRRGGAGPAGTPLPFFSSSAGLAWKYAASSTRSAAPTVPECRILPPRRSLRVSAVSLGRSRAPCAAAAAAPRRGRRRTQRFTGDRVRAPWSACSRRRAGLSSGAAGLTLAPALLQLQDQLSSVLCKCPHWAFPATSVARKGNSFSENCDWTDLTLWT